MAPAALTLKELRKRYTDFLKFQNNLAHKIETECERLDLELSKVCPRAFIQRRFVSNVGYIYTVQYCVDVDDKNATRRVEEAVSRDRIMYYDYDNVDQILADSLCDLMMQVPEPGEIFDPKYFKYQSSSVQIQNYPFAEDDSAPQLGFCGGCCGPHRKYIRYTMKEKEDGHPDPPLFLYQEPE